MTDTSEKPEPARGPSQAVALKDRIALRVKSLQQAAPGAAADLAARVKAGVSSAKLDKLSLDKFRLDKLGLEKLGLDKINRESLKAGRDGLAAKVEALLKPRAAEDAPLADKAPLAPVPPAHGEGPAKADESQRADISALKARLDAALRPKDEAGVTIKPDAASAGIAARIAAALPKRDWPKSDWTLPFTRSKRAVDGTPGDLTFVTGRAPLPDVEIIELPPASQPRTVTSRTQRLKTERIVTATRPKRSLLTLGMLMTALVTGSVLHIVTTFAVPMLSSSIFRWSAFDRIKGQLEINAMKVWPIDAAGAMPLPFLSPDMRYAFCRFDITAGPVNVSAVLPGVGWSLALYTPQGDNFYAVPGQDGRAVETVFNIVPASDRLLIPVPGQRRADVDAALVTSTSREGLVVVRGPNKGAASLPAVDAALKRARCVAVDRR